MADNTINVKIQEAVDTEANWKSKNPVLLKGQLAYTSDESKTGFYKIGNGTSKWTELSYAKAEPYLHTHTKSQITDFPLALKNPNSITIQFNGTTDKVYDGSSAQTVNITPAGIGASTSDHTHNSIKDAGNGTNITFAYSKAGLDTTSWLAAWNGYELRSISTSKVNVANATTATKLGTSSVGNSTTPIYLSSGVATECSGRTVPGIKSATSITTLGYGTNNNHVADISQLSFWNGCYSGTSSHLQYCDKGRFGTIVTKDSSDYLPIVGGVLIGNLAIRGNTEASNSYGSANPTLSFYNSTASKNLSLIYTDSSTIQSPSSLTLIGNQGGEYFIAPNIKATSRFYGNVTGNVIGDVSGSSGSCTGNSATATKLHTTRTITFNGDITGSFTFDGSSDINCSLYPYYASISVGNTNNYPFHRFAKLDVITGSNVDKSSTFLITQDYSGGGYGIIKISLRTNSGTTLSTISIEWLVRKGLSEDSVQAGIYNVCGETYADVFFKTNTTYAGTVIRNIASGSRGSVSRTWTLINSNEVNNTTTSTSSSSIECYSTIANAGSTLHGKNYSVIVPGTDTGIVNSANNSTKVYSALTNPSGTTYYIPFHSSASSEYKTLRNNDGLGYYTLQGTTTGANGRSELILGNNIESGSTGNKYGTIKLYGIGTGSVTIQTPPQIDTLNYTIMLPFNNGTIALTSSTVASAYKLATARTISLTGSVTGSASFDGSGDINISTVTNHTHSYLPLSGGTMSGNATVSKSSGDVGWFATRSDTGVTVWAGVGSGGVNHGLYSSKLNKWMVYGDANNVYLSGNAASATKLVTPRTISLTGSVTGSVNFDGSGNVSLATTTNHNHDSAYAAKSHTHNTIGSGNNIVNAATGNDCAGLSKKNNVNVDTWYGFSVANKCAAAGQGVAGDGVAFSVNARSGDVYSAGKMNPYGGIQLPNTATSWIGGMTSTKCLVGTAYTSTSGGSFHPILRQNTYHGNVFTLGGISYSTSDDRFGVYIYKSGQTANAANYATYWNAADGAIRHNGEYVSGSANAFRAVQGNYGFFIRNDGSNTWFLLTNSGNQYGGYNSFRPLQISNSTGAVFIGGRSVVPPDGQAAIRPNGDGNLTCGHPSYRYEAVYAKNGTIQTSDEKEKNILKPVDERYKKLYMSLNAIEYRWKDGGDKKIHIGLGARSVERKAIECGIPKEDIGMIQYEKLDEPTKNGQTDRYGMNYQEIAVLTIPIVQDHENRITELDTKTSEIDSRFKLMQDELDKSRELISRLETELEKLRTA